MTWGTWGETDGCGLAQPGEERLKRKLRRDLTPVFNQKAIIEKTEHNKGRQATVTCCRMGNSDYLYRKHQHLHTENG